MAEIVSREDFSEYEDEERAVRLCGSYGGSDIYELYVRLHPNGRAVFTRISGGVVQKWQLSAVEAAAFVEAWQAYHADYERWKRDQISEARRLLSVHLGYDWKLLIHKEEYRYEFWHGEREIVRSGEMKYLLPTVQEYIKRQKSECDTQPF